MQQNNKCRFSGDRDETINHIIIECRQLGQKAYMTRHDGWARSSTWSCARYLYLTIRINGLCITHHVLKNDTYVLL